MAARAMKLPDRLKHEIPKPPAAPLPSAPPFAFTVRETATYGRVDERRVWDAIATKKLKARTVGRRTVVLREDADEWLRSLPVRVNPYAEAIEAAMYASLDETASVAAARKETVRDAEPGVRAAAQQAKTPILVSVT